MASKTDDRRYGVHRKYDEFPAGARCDLTCDDLPDDEDGFYITGHYHDMRTGRQNPSVTDDVVDALLNDSEVRISPDADDKLLLQDEVAGYEWTIVVGDDRDEPTDLDWALVTVYSNYHGTVGTTNRYFDRKFDHKD